jgi:hypothetical protein
MPNPTKRELAVAAAEERLAARRAAQTGDAACQCRHPKERHTLINGVYAHCRWSFGPGRGRCACGQYQPNTAEA